MSLLDPLLSISPFPPTILLLYASLLLLALLIFHLLNQLLKHFLYLRHIPRPSVGAYSLITRVYRSHPLETASWLNEESTQTHSALLYLTGPLHIVSNVLVLSASGVRSVTQANAPFERSSVLVNFVRPLTGPLSVFTTKGKHHRRLRQAISPPLKHDHIVQHLQRSFFLEAHRLCDAFGHEHGGQVTDPVRIIRDSTFRIVVNACFGQDFINAREVDTLCSLYHNALQSSIPMQVMNVITADLPWKIPFHWVNKAEQSKKVLHSRVRELCAHLQKSTRDGKLSGSEQTTVPKESLLGTILSTGSDLSTDELSGTVLTFLLAGQATTTVAVAWSLHLLGAHVEWQERIRREVEESQGDKESLEELDTLPSLNAFTKEVIRLYPPLLYTHRKVQHPSKKGVDLEGHFIPNGTTLRFPILALQTNRDVWGEDASDFNPDRWNRPLHPDAKWMWASFWFGSDSCIGQRFAMLELKAFVATLTKRFHITVDKQKDGLPSRWGINATPKNLNVYFKRRVPS